MLEVLKKVHKDIFERSVKASLEPLPTSGEYSHEFSYKYCFSDIPELKGFIIVVAKKLDFHNLSIHDFSKVYYLYDSEGNYIEDSDMIIEAYRNFSKTLREINETLP